MQNEQECAMCAGDYPEDFEKKAMEERGYFGHLVAVGDEGTPTGCNFHTHGFWHSWKHPDIQVILNMPMEVVSPLFETAKDIAVKGGQIIPGRRYDNFLKGFEVEFAWAKECDRDVLRMILPDKEGETAKDKIAEPYSKQWEGTTERVTQGTYTQYSTKTGEEV